MRIENEDERSFYEIETSKAGWGVRILQRQYNSSVYERLALNKDKNGVLRLAKEGNVITKTEDIIKQPTVLEFLGMEEKAKYSETDLETSLINKLQKFLLELGKGYLFEARQKRFTYQEDNYYDRYKKMELLEIDAGRLVEYSTDVLSEVFSFGDMEYLLELSCLIG